MANVKLVLSLTLTGLVVLFVIQNVSVVEIRFLFWTFAISRALLIFLVLAVGIVVGWLLHSLIIHRRNLVPDD